MPSIYEYLPDSTRARYPLEALDERARRFLGTNVPRGYPQAKLARIVALAQRGVSRYEVGDGGRQPAAPASGQMLPAHGPARGAYDVWPRGKQLYAQAMESVGHELSQEPLGIPPPEGFAERAASIAGNLAGFIPKATLLSRIPGASHAGAVGAAMALSRGTPKERAIRGVTGAATAGVAGAAGAALRPVAGPAGGMATTAVGFGAVQPAAESLTHRLTGDPDYPAPTLQDMIRGTAEMGAINLLFGIPGLARGVSSAARRAGRKSSAQVLEDPRGLIGRGAPGREMPGRLRELPPGRVPRRRSLLPGPVEEVGPAREMPAGEGAGPAVFPASRQLPAGGQPGAPRVAGTGAESAGRRVLLESHPDLAADARLVAPGRTVGDMFEELVRGQVGKKDRPRDWRRAAERVVASGRMRAVQDVAEAVNPPRGANPDPALASREVRFAEELNKRAVGKSVTLNIDGQSVQAGVARVAVFRYPGVERPVRLVLVDPSNGRLFPLWFKSVEQLTQAVNNPEVVLRSQDVFRRSAAPKAAAGKGTIEGAPAAATKAAAPAAPPAREAPKPTAVERQMTLEIPKGPVKPIPADKAERYIARYAEGYAAKHAKAKPEVQAKLVEHLKQRAVDEADPVDRRAAVEALDRIRGGQAGTGVSPEAGPKAPPAAPAVKTAPVARKRVAIGMEFKDAKKAQAVADRLNRDQPDLGAVVAVRRGKPVVEVNEDAAIAPPKAVEKPVPKAEPAAAPAAPEKKAGAAPEAQGRGAPKAEGKGSAAGLAAPADGFAVGRKVVMRGTMEVGAVVELKGKRAVVEFEGGERREIALRDAQPIVNRKPPREPEKPAAPAEAELEAASRFKRGDRVSVPNNAIRRNDTRSRVEASVVGFEMVKGEPHVVVDVRRGSGRSQSKNLVRRRADAGKFSWVRESFPESRVIKKPTAASRAAAAGERAAKASRLAESIRERAAGSPAKARAIVREWEAKAQQAQDAAPDDAAGNAKAKEVWRRAMRAASVAEGVHAELVRKGGGSLMPGAHEFFARNEDVPNWTNPLREAAEDFPAHFTHERQAAYLKAAAGYRIASATEWKATIDLERSLAEAGVEPAQAARAVDATERIRRYLEQNADNPLLDAAEVKALREEFEPLLDPARLRTPEGVETVLADFNKRVPEGPADDIPAGNAPAPPADFVRGLSERGFANADALAPWLWLKALRDIPRKLAAIKQRAGRKAQSLYSVDANGNRIAETEHGLWEPDRYSESAVARLLSYLRLGGGSDILSPDRRADYKASLSQQAKNESLWAWQWVSTLGPDVAARLRPHSKLSRLAWQVLDGKADAAKLPEDVRAALPRIKAFYRAYWKWAQKQYEMAGQPPPESKLEGDYFGPHLMLDRISETSEARFADLLGLERSSGEVREANTRFLHERTGDPVYEQDVALAFLEYNRAMSKHAAFLSFFERLKNELRTSIDQSRKEATANFIRATLLRKKWALERMMDSAFSALRFAKSAPIIEEVGLGSAEHLLGLAEGSLTKGTKHRRAFRVPEGAEYRVGGTESGKATLLGTLADGDRIVATQGPHLFVTAKPEIRAWEKKWQMAKARGGVEWRDLLERANRKLTGHVGEFRDPRFSKDEDVRVAFEEWRHRVLSARHSLTDATFRAIGDNQIKALLGGNLRNALSNSTQILQTLLPEIGFGSTLRAVLRTAVRPLYHKTVDQMVKRGQITAERGEQLKADLPTAREKAQFLGTLQGEISRVGELSQDRSWFHRLYNVFGDSGLGLYRMSEDFSRGVSVVATEALARRMGYPNSPITFAPHRSVDARYFGDWQQHIDSMRKSGTVENLAAHIDSDAMFDYNMLGQAPIFGGPIGKLFGRLMTFPTQFARRYFTRPLGASAKVGRALVLGGIDKATGGRLAKAGMKVGPGPRFVKDAHGRTRVAGGKYPAPRNAFERFLDHYGARFHDRQGTVVALRQITMVGALLSFTALTGLNAMLVGTPGWEWFPLSIAMALTPEGGAMHERLRRLREVVRRASIISPERGVENTMSPTIRLGWELATQRKKPHEAALEFGRQQAIPGLSQIRRTFQNMPHAEQFFETEAGRAFAYLLGIKSYIRGNGVRQAIKGAIGLTPAEVEMERRVQIKDRRERAKRQKPRRAQRASVYSSVLGNPAVTEVFA